MTKKKATKTKSPFYSAKGIATLIVALLVLSVFALWGLYTIGAIRLPEKISALFAEETTAPLLSGAVANIAPENSQAVLKEAVPREEYAYALSEMDIPSSYFRRYTITLQSGNYTDVTNYYAVKDGENWWVQTEKNHVILTTAFCKDGIAYIADNAQNTSVSALGHSAENAGGVSFEERCGILTLETLVEIIRCAAAGEPVEYGGGIRDYSLSFTPSRGTGENLFTFSFVNGSGIAEEYTFAFESARILSATKALNGNVIYKMELKDYRNELTDFNTAALFTVQ